VTGVMEGSRLRRSLILPPNRWPTLDFAELWDYRAICFVLVQRMLKVRYKQTVLGAGWAVIQPVMLMLVFTIFFGILVAVPSEGAPYPLFVFVGLVVWQFVARVLNEASASIALNGHLVTKIYFPRVFLPVAVLLASLVDLAFAVLALALLMAIYGVMPGWPIIFMPLWMLLASVAVLGLSLWLSALYAAYRDVGHLLPFMTQLWMFLTPIIYPSSLVPEAYRLLYALNPLVAAVEGLRWACLGAPPPAQATVLIGTASAILLLATGYVFFRKRESFFSDVV
jgi:lipopolysaccharide transport system permease protein